MALIALYGFLVLVAAVLKAFTQRGAAEAKHSSIIGARTWLSEVNDAALNILFNALYLVYFAVVKTAYQVLHCGANEAGVRVLVADPSVRCDGSDAGYNIIYPWSVVALAGYGLGIPVLFAGVLYKYGRLIRLDQILRERNEGNTVYTNPQARARAHRTGARTGAIVPTNRAGAPGV